MSFNGHAEHLRGRGLIDFAVGAEHLQPPLLTGQPGDDTGLNGRKVSVNEDMTLRGHKSGADELAESVRHGAIDQPEGIQLAVLHQLTGPAAAALCRCRGKFWTCTRRPAQHPVLFAP